MPPCMTMPSIGDFAIEEFVDFVVDDELHGRRPAPLDLFLLVLVGEGRQRVARDVARRMIERVHAREVGPHIVLRDEES